MNPGDMAIIGGWAPRLDWVRQGANLLGFRHRSAHHRVLMAPPPVPELRQREPVETPGWMVGVRADLSDRGLHSVHWFLVAEPDRARAAAMARQAVGADLGALVEFSREPMAAHTLRHLGVPCGGIQRWEAGDPPA